MVTNDTTGDPVLQGRHQVIVISKPTRAQQERDLAGEAGCPCNDWWRSVACQIGDELARHRIARRESIFWHERE